MNHDPICNYLDSSVPVKDCAICYFINKIRWDERDQLRAYVDGVYRITGDGLIRTVLEYIDKRESK